MVSAGLAVLLCEAAQLAVVAVSAWLVAAEKISGGVLAGSPATTALSIAVHSRGGTRPARLLFQVWTARRIRRALLARNAKARARLVMRIAGATSTAVALIGVLLVYAEGWIPGGSIPPLALFCRTLARGMQALLSSLGWEHAVDPQAVARGAAAACVWLRTAAVGAAGMATAAGEAAKSVKPLRALLDLSETDAWVFDTLCEGSLSLGSLLQRVFT
jgi:hypothetical protein